MQKRDEKVGENLVRHFLTILLPILVTQLSMYAMSFFDTLMSGQASPEDLAGVAIGSSIWVPVYTGLSGILSAITPIVAQLLGAGKQEQVAPKVIQGLYLALLLAFVVLLSGKLTLFPLLSLMDLEPEVRRIAFHYLVALSFGMVPVFVYAVIRSFIDALGYTRVTMIITLVSVPLNVFLNDVLIFGKYGFPALGGVGAGVASAITYWIIMFISMSVIHFSKPFAGYHIFRSFQRVSFRVWKELLGIGVPIGLAIFLEVSIFALVALLMSRFDTATIAAHQAAMNFATLLYMIPLSISMALTIVVGYEVGARRFAAARHYTLLGVGAALFMALFNTLILSLFNRQVAGLYTNDPVVLELTRQFLSYAIFFQFLDAIATPIYGTLRGYKDVKATFYLTLISYWAISLPLGHVLAVRTHFGASGYWIGLITGVGVLTFSILLRLIWIQRRRFLLNDVE